MITLQKGDYVGAGLTEDQYDEVCQAFINAGADYGEAFIHSYYIKCDNVGWYKDNEVYHTDYSYKFKRKLTYSDVINATNSGMNDTLNVGEYYELRNDKGYALPYGQDLMGKNVKVISLFNDLDADFAVVSYESVFYVFRTDMLHQIPPKAPELSDRERFIKDNLDKSESLDHLLGLIFDSRNDK